MLEIVFNESVLGSMEQAAINATHRKPENLFCFPLPLDRGDIQKEFAAACEPLAALLAQAKDTPLRIWSSDAPQEKCGLYWLVAQLEPLGWENLDVSLVELPAFLGREDGVVVQYRAWGEVCPEEWSRWKTAGVRLPSLLLRAMADRWKELRRENAPLRAVLNGRLVSAPETLYDFFLFQEIAAQPEEFREEEVIGRVLGVTQMPISDEFLALRMEQMIRDGLLEAVTQPGPGEASYRRVLRKVTLK